MFSYHTHLLVRALICVSLTSASAQAASQWPMQQSLAHCDNSQFQSYEAMYNCFRSVASQNPHNSEVISIGNSSEGRDIFGIHIWGASRNKKSAIITSGMAARDWGAPAVTQYLASSLMAPEKALNKILADTNLYIVPLVNPDGYEYSSKGLLLYPWAYTANAYPNDVERIEKSVKVWSDAIKSKGSWKYIYEIGTFANVLYGLGGHPLDFAQVSGIPNCVNADLPSFEKDRIVEVGEHQLAGLEAYFQYVTKQ